MLGLIKELILAEVKIDPKITEQICRKAIPVYNLTYNQSEPKVEDLIDFMQDHKLTNNKLVSLTIPIFAVILQTTLNPSRD